MPVSVVCWARGCGEEMLPAGGNIPQRVNGAGLPLGMGAGGWWCWGAVGALCHHPFPPAQPFLISVSGNAPARPCEGLGGLRACSHIPW